MFARRLLLSALFGTLSAAHADLTYGSVSLHGDGSVTYLRPRFVAEDGTSYPIRAGAAGRLCRAFGFDDADERRAVEDPRTTAVGISAEGRVLAPAPADQTLESVRCVQPEVGTHQGFY